jgi:hypothetical protein
MKTIRINRNSRVNHYYEVELEGDETDLPDLVLISMADGVSREDAIESFRQKSYRHFGGTVSRGNPITNITVYVD